MLFFKLTKKVTYLFKKYLKNIYKNKFRPNKLKRVNKKNHN